MIYKLLVSLADDFAIFNVFRYITFRSVASFLTSFLVVWLLGKPFIRKIQLMQFGQQVRDDGPQTHKKKQGTPTLGGLLILMGVFFSALFWSDLSNPFVISTLLITLLFGGIGFADDYLKISKKNTKGLSGKVRLIMEFAIVGVVLGVLVQSGFFGTELSVPFFKEVRPDLGWLYILFAAFVTVGCANAVNLTDGLDGLATAPVVLASFALGVFAYVHGHAEIARYLQLNAIQGVGELTPLAGAMIGAGLGFLWYNSYPAQIFMGDVGSLSLGGFIGSLAVFTKNEILLALVGGVFVVEALSVITQVASFKLTGKRIFKMAPIHHHFELTGVQEPKVIIRFWIVSILLAVLSLSTLKLR